MHYQGNKVKCGRSVSRRVCKPTNFLMIEPKSSRYLQFLPENSEIPFYTKDTGMTPCTLTPTSHCESSITWGRNGLLVLLLSQWEKEVLPSWWKGKRNTQEKRICKIASVNNEGLRHVNKNTLGLFLGCRVQIFASSSFTMNFSLVILMQKARQEMRKGHLYLSTSQYYLCHVTVLVIILRHK